MAAGVLCWTKHALVFERAGFLYGSEKTISLKLWSFKVSLPVHFFLLFPSVSRADVNKLGLQKKKYKIPRGTKVCYKEKFRG